MAHKETRKLREPGRKLRRGLLKLLADQALGNNGRLPHFYALAAQFGVSYASVSRIVGQLRREGRVAVFPGKGVFAVQGAVSKAGTPHHIRLGPDLAALLSKADIQALRRHCPDAAIETASGIPDRDADLGLVDAESVLIRTHRGTLATASKLGFGRAEAERLGVDPLHLAQVTLNGELGGLPIAINPLLAGIRANLRGDEPARRGSDGRVTLDSLADFALRHTRDSGQEARRMSGFDFYNHTLHTHALTRAAGGDWYGLEAFYGETTLRALRRLWELIHRNRTCLMLVSSATPVTRLDVWKMDRVALLFANYHEISALLHKPRSFQAAQREILAWGGEPSRYLCLSGKSIVRPELYKAAAELLASPRLQIRILRRGWGLPATVSPAVWQKADRLLGRQCDPLRAILKTTYNPYRIDGSPEAFWQAEYTVRDYLADLYQIGAKDADSVARRRENTQRANREAPAAGAPWHSRKGDRQHV